MKFFYLLFLTFYCVAITKAQNVNVAGAVIGNGSYATLSAAFTAINGAVQTGAAIAITIVVNTTEPAGGAMLNAGVWTSISVQPSGGAARTITGAATAGFPLIDLNGADNVTIDGLNTGGNSLTISNTTVSVSSGTSTIRFIEGATNNVINNCSVLGSANMALTTNGGNIYFATDITTANGNDNNTISNCNIGPAGANLPTKCIYGNGSITTSAKRNNGILISNNNIFDFFISSSNSSGIYILSGNDGWTIADNRIYQTAPRTFTAGPFRYSGITINSTVGIIGSFTITGNKIGFADAAGSGTTTITGSSNEFRGIDIVKVSGTAATSIQGNTISGIFQTSSRASTTTTLSCFIGIVLGENGGVFNCGATTGNTIGSLDASSNIVVASSSVVSNTAPMMGIYDQSLTGNTISNNNIGSITINANAGGTALGFRGIFINSASGAIAIVNNNTIGGTATGSITDNIIGATGAGGYSMYGIVCFTANINATGNLVRNMTGFSSSGPAMYGMYISGSNGDNLIAQNSIHSLINTAVIASGVAVSGLVLGFSNTTNIVDRNFIHSLYNNSINEACTLTGITASATGGTATYSNNIIRLGIKADGTSITEPYQIMGIQDISGNSSNFYHNSVYVGGSGVASATAAKTYAFSSTVITNTRNFENNIFWNARSNAAVSGTARHFAVRAGGTTQYPAGLTSNYNVIYANGNDGAIGEFNGSANLTLPDWRTATGQDMISIAADPQFINPTGTAATVNLHLQPATFTVCEGNGHTGIPVLADFDGQARSSLTPVDIGADAGDFFNPTLTDLIGPEISYTPLSNNSCLVSGPVLSAIITDINGVNTTAGTKPRLYYKRSTDANTFTNNTIGGVGWKYVEASNATSPFSFTINYTLLSGGTGVAAGNTIQYFVTAQDLVATTNVSINSGIYAPAFMPASVALTATAFPVYVPIRSYTITAPGLPANVTIGAAGTYTTLTGAGGLFAAINSSGIDVDVTATIIDASVTETGVNALNQMTFGCGGPLTLTIKPLNTGTVLTGSLSSDALIKIKSNQVIIDGSSNGTASQDLSIINTGGVSPNVLLIGSAGTAGVTNVTVKNTVIINGSTIDNTAYAIVVSDGSAIGGPGYFTNITLQNNDIQKSYIGIYVKAMVSAGNGSININSNKLNSTINKIGNTGIYVEGADGTFISGNDIGNFESVTGEVDRGIWLSMDSKNILVEKNNIHDIKYTGGSGYGGKGIVVSSGLAAANITIVNNMLYGIAGDGDSYSGNGAYYCPAAIYTFGTAQGGVNIYYNSIYLSGATLNFAADVYSFGIALDNNTAATIKNNIVLNELGLLAGTGVGAVGIASQNASQFTALDFNDYYSNAALGTNLIGKIGATDYSTLAAWQTATGQEVNSMNIKPIFVAANNLHLAAAGNCAIDGYGTPVAGITTDYDNQARDAASPDMGADEFTASLGVTLAGIAGAAVCENKTVSVAGTTYTTGNCELIAKVLPSGGSMVSGKINTCVTLNDMTGILPVFNAEPYVTRHYDIEPVSANTTTTSATITLYFTQAEFDNFNDKNAAWPDLPTGPADAVGIANLKVTQYHGIATTTPSEAGMYSASSGGGVYIDPVDTDITWNGSYWSVTFNVTGFSGFYVHTNIRYPLPITINYFTGVKQNGNHLLNWKVTCNSTPAADIELQRSPDGRSFAGIYSIYTTALRCQQPFDYTDNNPVKGVNYYRLKLTDATGKISYSNIISLINASSGIEVMNIAPNPVVGGKFNVLISSASGTAVELQISDLQGRIIHKQTASLIAGFNTIPVSVQNLSAGTYQVMVITAGGERKLLRFVVL